MHNLFDPPINNLEKFLYKQNKDNKLFQIIQNEEIFVSVCWHDGPSYEYIITLAEITKKDIFVEKGEKIVIKNESLFEIKEFLRKKFVIIVINNISESESVPTIAKK
jgi:hypothetical protein